ncbi:FitA-like ribbon-helix-helix domain-containing protein [Sphingomonas abietis]|uniref:FitA-like ribbon-helix-helix domain-containing protein n=1 Tax=Sphingomonas abietis TaxID=3012344 RepID=UPI00389AD897
MTDGWAIPITRSYRVKCSDVVSFASQTDGRYSARRAAAAPKPLTGDRDAMPTMTIRDVPDDLLRSLKDLATAHGRSVQAEVRIILAAAVQAGCLGDALWRLGREIGLTETEIMEIESSRQRKPADPLNFD